MIGHLTPTTAICKLTIITNMAIALETQIVDTMTPAFVAESESENEKEKSKRKDLLESTNK